MATTASGVTVPGSSPTTTAATPIQDHWNNLGKSLNGRLIVPVASVTAWAALVSALTAEGYTISTSNPLYTHRADANPGQELEVTINGSTWQPVVMRVAGSAIASAQTPTTSAWAQVTCSSDDNLTGGVTRAGAGLTVPVAGLYAISATGSWPGSSTGRRGIAGGRNNVVFPSSDAGLNAAVAAGAFNTPAPTVLKTCAAGDVINLYAYQDSGSTLSAARLDVWRIA